MASVSRPKGTLLGHATLRCSRNLMPDRSQRLLGTAFFPVRPNLQWWDIFSLFGIVSIGVFMIYWNIVAIRRKRSWLLVITDDGVVQYKKNLSLVGQFFNIPLTSVAFSDAHMSTVGGVTTLWTHPNGMLLDWQPDSAFGPREVIMSQVLTAFESYTARQHETQGEAQHA